MFHVIMSSSSLLCFEQQNFKKISSVETKFLIVPFCGIYLNPYLHFTPQIGHKLVPTKGKKKDTKIKFLHFLPIVEFAHKTIAT